MRNIYKLFFTTMRMLGLSRTGSKAVDKDVALTEELMELVKTEHPKLAEALDDALKAACGTWLIKNKRLTVSTDFYDSRNETKRQMTLAQYDQMQCMVNDKYNEVFPIQGSFSAWLMMNNIRQKAK